MLCSLQNYFFLLHNDFPSVSVYNAEYTMYIVGDSEIPHSQIDEHLIRNLYSIGEFAEMRNALSWCLGGIVG